MLFIDLSENFKLVLFLVVCRVFVLLVVRDDYLFSYLFIEIIIKKFLICMKFCVYVK